MRHMALSWNRDIECFRVGSVHLRCCLSCSTAECMCSLALRVLDPIHTDSAVLVHARRSFSCLRSNTIQSADMQHKMQHFWRVSWPYSLLTVSMFDWAGCPTSFRRFLFISHSFSILSSIGPTSVCLSALVACVPRPELVALRLSCCCCLAYQLKRASSYLAADLNFTDTFLSGSSWFVLLLIRVELPDCFFHQT